MSEPSQMPAPDSSPIDTDRSVSERRDGGATAPGRCLLYAVFSDVLASPFDADPAVATAVKSVDDLELPYVLELANQALQVWRDSNNDELKREYSGLFEVGSKGPPVPIREDLHRNQPAGVREDIVRFYDFFGYGLEEKFAWAPDHLSVELEFMHFLVYQESQATDGALSFQLAQYDFAERHLINWAPELLEKVTAQQPGSTYGKLLGALNEFLEKDCAWQRSTIV